MNNKQSKKPKQSNNKPKPKPKKQLSGSNRFLAPSKLRPFPNQFIKD